MEDNDLGNPQLAEEPLVWRHPQEPILTVEGSTHLVFLQGKYPSKVAYREGQGTILFWDLGYLWDVFREEAEERQSSKFLNDFKRLAMCDELENELHIRGKVDRCGFGKLTFSSLGE